MGPAVRVDNAVGDALDHAGNRVTKILRSRKHRGEQNEQRERELKSMNLKKESWSFYKPCSEDGRHSCLFQSSRA